MAKDAEAGGLFQLDATVRVQDTAGSGYRGRIRVRVEASSQEFRQEDRHGYLARDAGVASSRPERGWKEQERQRGRSWQ